MESHLGCFMREARGACCFSTYRRHAGFVSTFALVAQMTSVLDGPASVCRCLVVGTQQGRKTDGIDRYDTKGQQTQVAWLVPALSGPFLRSH